jgi:hypothetical protein
MASAARDQKAVTKSVAGAAAPPTLSRFPFRAAIHCKTGHVKGDNSSIPNGAQAQIQT